MPLAPPLRLVGVLLVLGVFGACGQQPTSDEAPPAPPTARARPPAHTAGDEVDVRHFPVTIPTCDRSITFEAPPQRVVTNDVNITELFLALDLHDRLMGYSGIRDVTQLAPAYQATLAGVPALAARAPSLEVLTGVAPDVYLAGWHYGLSAESGLTPDSLRNVGIQTYAITESCIRIMPRTRVSMEDTFTDLLNLGRMFGVDARAQRLVETYRTDLAQITAAIGAIEAPLRVFVYDSGDATPTTAAQFALPHAMIETAGGTNIFQDVASSWTQVNWEHVVERNPQWIVIIDYDSPDAAGKIAFLKRLPTLATVEAITQDQFVVLSYAEATPGPRNVAATRRLAAAFYPAKLAAAARAVSPPPHDAGAP